MSLRNIMLTLAYDGTAYCGWQVQPKERGVSIQQCVETAVERVTGVKTPVLCAGRTDTGVHAIGQVANFRTSSQIPGGQFRRALQSRLPEDITIVRAVEVAPAFHATYAAVRKRYRYVFFDGPVAVPFLKNLMHRSRHPLNAAAMHAGAQYLLGTHDFRCFETQYPNKQTSVRTIMEAGVTRIPVWPPWQSTHQWMTGSTHISETRSDAEAAAPFVVFDVMADGFLYNMVRAIAGTLIRVGLEQRPPEDIADVIRSQNRASAGMNLPPGGLFLISVDYPPELLVPPSSSLTVESTDQSATDSPS